jgi:CubicO group peptidase (beta-lactamase class C family)
MGLLPRLVLALPLLVVGAPAGALAQPGTGTQPPKSFDPAAIDAYVAARASETGEVGLSLAIVQNGKVVLAKGFGQANLKPSHPVTADTPFAIGSVTKQFTCACILLLAEEGKLSVRDPVARYFPDLTRAGDVTLYDLMTHTSGYPDYYPLDFVDRRLLKPIACDQLIQDYAGSKLDFEPGTRWSYSNTGYVILGRVVEKASGEPFGRFLERRILRPLGMEHARFDPGADAEGLPQGYLSFALGPPEMAKREAAGWLYAAGGLYATASEVAAWDLALADGKLLKPESFKLMSTPRQLAGGRTTDYACGLHVTQRDGQTILKHNGAVSGFQSFNAIIPRTRSAVVLLANVENRATAALHSTLLSLLLKDQGERDGPAVPQVVGLSPKEAGLEFFHQMQAGKVDRGRLGEEFSLYLTDERVRAAAVRLQGLGEPEKVEVVKVGERGGMEVADLRFTFKTAVLGGTLYRTPDGKIQQLLFERE